MPLVTSTEGSVGFDFGVFLRWIFASSLLLDLARRPVWSPCLTVPIRLVRLGCVLSPCPGACETCRGAAVRGECMTLCVLVWYAVLYPVRLKAFRAELLRADFCFGLFIMRCSDRLCGASRGTIAVLSIWLAVAFLGLVVCFWWGIQKERVLSASPRPPVCDGDIFRPFPRGSTHRPDPAVGGL